MIRVGGNPIRKARGFEMPPPRPGDYSVHYMSYWYAMCTACGDRIQSEYAHHRDWTRKQAKDRLYWHYRERHAPPDGDSV